MGPVTWLATWLLLVLGVISLLLPLYGRLLSLLRRREPRAWDALGRPTLFMASPRRSLALQAYIWRGARTTGTDADVARLAAWLRVLTPLLVGGLLLSFAAGFYLYLLPR